MTFAFFEEPEGGLPVGAGEDKPLRLTVLIVELTDPERARALMDGLTRPHGDGKPVARRRRFGDLDGWEVRFEMEPLYVAGAGGLCFIAVGFEPIVRLAKWLGRDGEKLVDTREFKRSTAWIPADAGFVGYSNVREVLRSFHKLVASGMKREGAKLPPLEDLLEGVTPFTAALRIEEPGFALDVRSPAGFWMFYWQLAAHLVWQVDVEPRAARKAAREKRLRADPRYVAGLAVLKDLNVRLAGIKDSGKRIAVMKETKLKVAGTAHVRTIDMMIRRERSRGALDKRRADAGLAKAFRRLKTRVAKLKSRELKIAELQRAKERFKGTRYEKMVGAMIMLERKRIMAERARMVAERKRTVAMMFAKLRNQVRKLKTPEARLRTLEARLPMFKGTRYEEIIEKMIAGERARIEQETTPEPDRDDDAF